MPHGTGFWLLGFGRSAADRLSGKHCAKLLFGYRCLSLGKKIKEKGVGRNLKPSPQNSLSNLEAKDGYPNAVRCTSGGGNS